VAVVVGVTARDVRDRLAASLTTSLPSWSESRSVADLYPADARGAAHLSWAVGLTATTPAALDRQSTRGGSAVRVATVTTAVVVRWGHRLRADAQVEDYAAALTAEAALVDALLAVDREGLAVRVGRLSRAVAGDGLLLVGTVELEVLHRLPLYT
jgi:hypothetical protein